MFFREMIGCSFLCLLFLLGVYERIVFDGLWGPFLFYFISWILYLLQYQLTVDNVHPSFLSNIYVGT